MHMAWGEAWGQGGAGSVTAGLCGDVIGRGESVFSAHTALYLCCYACGLRSSHLPQLTSVLLIILGHDAASGIVRVQCCEMQCHEMQCLSHDPLITR